MRFFPLLLWLFLAALFSGCAYEGVVVRKNSRPQPFYESLGIDGSYTFILRDRAGVLHRQLVTPEVFDRYAIGDYFNDLQPATFRDFKAYDGKEMLSAARPTSSHHARLTNKPRANKSRQVASHVRPPRVKLAKRTKASLAKAEALSVAQVSRIAKPVVLARGPASAESEFVFVTIARCR